MRALGYEERFLRTWEFYLAYCEAGFASGCTDVHHFEIARPR
jgi:cyclopropane-fatty-acyl-phospholipid synthase